MRVRIDAAALHKSAVDMRRSAHRFRALAHSRFGVSAESWPAELAHTRLEVHSAQRRLESFADALDERATALQNRIRALEAVGGGRHFLALAGGLRWTKPERLYLYPRGKDAVYLKHKLAVAARRAGIAFPPGFRPNVPYMGAAARHLLALLQRKHHLLPTGAFDTTTRALLAKYPLPHLRVDPVGLDYPGNNASRQAMACWLAAHAAAAGAPPELLIMCSLTETGGRLRNLGYGDADSVGFFQIRPSTNFVPHGFGLPGGTKRGAGWWVEHPAAQVALFEEKIKATVGGSRNHRTSDPAALGRWCQDLERSAYPDRYQSRYREAHRLAAKCVAAASASNLAAVANKELGRGVHESGGEDHGPRVHLYQSATGAYGAAWCASFVTWCMRAAGHPMPHGYNWAYAGTWATAAREHHAGLRTVGAGSIRPGDVVVFNGSEHIGIITKVLPGGRFETTEGNWSDAVSRVQHTTTHDRYWSQMTFIRPAA